MESTESISEAANDLLHHLILLRRTRHRREGSLAAALTQSMALAMIGTAGAYPSWVLVRDGEREIVLGAAWAIAQIDPRPDTPLLGRAGGPLMMAIAFCCLFSVASGSLGLTMDFLGLRRCRSLAPLFHGLTATLIGCAAAMGSCLLALLRGRSFMQPALEADNVSASPGQSLFLAFLACMLASTATGLSCMSPARVQPARSSWDLAIPSTQAGEFRRRYGKVLRGNKRVPAANASEDDAAAHGRFLLPRQLPPLEEEEEPLPEPELQARNSSLRMFWESESEGNLFQGTAREGDEAPNRGQAAGGRYEASAQGQAPSSSRNAAV